MYTYELTPLGEGVNNFGVALTETGLLYPIGNSTFSTNSDTSLQGLGERLLDARDTGIPLVEVSLAELGDPADNALALPDELPLVAGILSSSGAETVDSYFGKEVTFSQVGLSLPGQTIYLDEDDGSREIRTYISNGRYNRYETNDARSAKPSFGEFFSYEDDFDYFSNTPFDQRCRMLLRQSCEFILQAARRNSNKESDPATLSKVAGLALMKG